MSLDAIPTLETMDVWIIDGDHNWYTVSNELELIRKKSKEEKKPLLIFLHDVNKRMRLELSQVNDPIIANLTHRLNQTLTHNLIQITRQYFAFHQTG